MCLTNNGLWRAVEALVAQTPKAVVLGGGGYNPWTTVRCWVGLWGRLTGQDVAVRLPEDATAILAAFECDLVDEEDVAPGWLTGLSDREVCLPVREEIRALARRLISRHGLIRGAELR